MRRIISEKQQDATAPAGKEYIPNAAAAARRAKAREEKRHPIETTETNSDWRKLPRSRPDKDDKHLAYSILIANGVQKEKACSMLGYSVKTVRSIDRALVKKSLKLELLSEQRIKKAYRVIDRCLAGKTFGEVEVIKDSTALRAAEVVIDRSDPRAIQASAPVYSFTRINLNEARWEPAPVLTDGGSPDIPKETTIEVDPNDPE